MKVCKLEAHIIRTAVRGEIAAHGRVPPLRAAELRERARIDSCQHELCDKDFSYGKGPAVVGGRVVEWSGACLPARS